MMKMVINIPEKDAGWIAVKDLKMHPLNPREHTPEQIKKIARSIDENDWGRPLVISQDNYILAGHGAYLAATDELNLMSVPFRRMNHLHDAPEAIAYMLADNKLTDESSWNYGKLELNFQELELQGYDLTLTGFDEKDLLNIKDIIQGDKEVIEDDFNPDEVTESIVQPGEIWQLGNHRLMCGDSTRKEDVNHLMKKDKANLIMTSPPYWVGKEYETQENEKEIEIFIDNIVKSCLPVIKKDYSRIIINSGTALASTLNEKNPRTILLIDKWINSLLKKEWLLRHIRFWVKGGTGPPKSHKTDTIYYGTEFLLVFYNPKGRKRGQEKISVPWAQEGNWKIQGDKQENDAGFPVEIPARFIKLYTKPEEIVFDMFGGNGTTLIASEQLGRTCFMMELDPHYCDVILKRWEKFTGEHAIKEA